MSTASIAFAVRHRTPGGHADLRARLAALEGFYAPLALGATATEDVESLALTVGVIGPADIASRRLLWGAPFGVRRPEANETLRSGDRQLRSFVVGLGLAIAWSDDAARVLTAPCGPIGGYTAASEHFEVWATHAVAAAWLAHGEVRIDADAIPELIAFDSVGQDRSLVAGAVPLPAATCVDLAPEAVTTHDYWPPAERWLAVPEDDAQTYGEASLLDSLARRTGGLDGVGICLTAGADSRVLAIALREIGASVSAVTWGEPGWTDVAGAGPLAEALGIPWEARAVWRTDEETVAMADADARWSDGAFGLAPSDRSWPAGTAAVMVGAAGEVGRAFYYRRLTEGPRPAELADALFPEGRLAGASTQAKELAREAARRWAAAALASGRKGWSLLDVLCAEQRVGHWGRSQVPRLKADFLAGFASMEVLRALSSLPLAERLAGGFHGRFVASRHPELALPAPPPPVAPTHSPERLRRLARRAQRPRPAPQTVGDGFLLSLWAQRPAARARIDEVLRSPLIAEALGKPWCDATRDGFAQGHPRRTAQALLASGPVALAEALRGLQAP